MITETTRRCSRCQGLLDGNERVCPACGREQCVPVADWPAGARKFLYLLVITDAVATKLTAGEQHQAEFLLENAIRGRHYRGKLITRSADAAECYPQFLTLFEQWQAQGSPTDFTALACCAAPARPTKGAEPWRKGIRSLRRSSRTIGTSR